MVKPIRPSSLALVSLALVACTAAAPPPQDVVNEIGESPIEASVAGSVFCGRLRRLNCAGHETCDVAYSGANPSVSARCAPLWISFLSCLDANAASATCASVMAAPPAACADAFRASESCATGGDDGGGAPSVAGDVGVALLGDATEQTIAITARRGAPTPRCAPAATMGSCNFFDCMDAEDSRPRVNAGEVTLTAGGVSAALRPNAMNEYAVENARFPAASTVTVHVAGGGDVPALGGTIAVPAMSNALAITAPTSGATINRSGDLVVDWSSEAYGAVRVMLSAGNAMVMCDLPAAERRAILPAPLLTRMPVGRATLSAIQFTERSSVVSGWRLTLGVWRSSALDGPALDLR